MLRGIFLARPSELDWFMHGMRNVFPEAWRAFSEFLPPAERGDLLGSYYRRLTTPTPPCTCPRRARGTATKARARRCCRRPIRRRSSTATRSALAIARIEAHYFVHRAFLAEPTSSSRNVGRIRHLPCTIVQGRYDIVCPPVTADTLARAWPEAEYIVVPDAGHSIREPGITRELVAAVMRMQARFAR